MLLPSGPQRPGAAIAGEDLTHAQTRDALDRILAKTRLFKQAGRKTDILTVDNHVDGVYLYLKLLAEGSPRAAGGLEAAHLERRGPVQQRRGHRLHRL